MPWAVFNDDHTRAIEEMLTSGSDRVIAILGGAILDDTLRRTLVERFHNDEDITNKLLRINGALGNAEPKIDVLYLLSGFGKPMRNAC
jgi:hypothetical protein